MDLKTAIMFLVHQCEMGDFWFLIGLELPPDIFLESISHCDLFNMSYRVIKSHTDSFTS